jgi:hypothetical protein
MNPSKMPSRPGYLSKLENWVSLLTLFAVAIYTAITVLLWHNSNKQLAISRDTEERQLRAYVHVAGTDFSQIGVGEYLTGLHPVPKTPS